MAVIGGSLRSLSLMGGCESYVLHKPKFRMDIAIWTLYIYICMYVYI